MRFFPASTISLLFGFSVSRLPYALVALFTTLLLTLAPNAPAQEANPGADEYEQTLFGLRRIDRSKSGTSAPSIPVPPNGTPPPTYTPTPGTSSSTDASRGNFTIATSPFRGTTWSFFNAVTNRTGTIEFRPDGSAKWFDGKANGLMKWWPNGENSVCLGHARDIFHLRPDKKSSMQSSHEVFRLWYKGTRPPSPSSTIRSRIVATIWENAQVNSIYEFRPDGSYVERYNGQVKNGRWDPLYGDAFRTRHSNEAPQTYTVSPDGSAILRTNSHYNDRYWVKRGLGASAATVTTSASSAATASSTPGNSSTTSPSTATPPAKSGSRTLDEEFSVLEQMRAADFAKALAFTNARDKRSLEDLKRQATTNGELTVLEMTQAALKAVENNDIFEADNPAHNKRLSRNATELWRIQVAREKALNDSVRNIAKHYKSAYEALRKRAIVANEFPLARQISGAEQHLSLLPGLSPFIGSWRLPDGRIGYIIRPNGVVAGRRSYVGLKTGTCFTSAKTEVGNRRGNSPRMGSLSSDRAVHGSRK